MLVRGKGRTVEVVLTGPFSQALGEVREHLDGRAGFYRGARATADLAETDDAGAEQIRELAAVFESFGVALDGVYGSAQTGASASDAQVAYLGLPPLADVASAVPRTRHPVVLSDRARSLTADFAGARADLAARRTVRGGIAAARNVVLPHGAARTPIGVSTLYHRGTLRGGQSLHNLGNVVVIGDLNPGAELVASGDIVVFGALRGVAHAGAQGDRTAVVVALELAPTQLRIATLIATDGEERGRTPVPECARIEGDRIAIVPHARAGLAPREIVR